MAEYPDVTPGATSFVTVLDLAVKELIWAKFQDLMVLDTKATDIVFYPKEVAMRQIAERRGETTVNYINFWRILVYETTSLRCMLCRWILVTTFGFGVRIRIRLTW